MDLVVQSPDELLAAVPHVLGFKPEESIVLVPFRPGLPITRSSSASRAGPGICSRFRGRILYRHHQY